MITIKIAVYDVLSSIENYINKTLGSNIDIFNTVKKLFDLENPRHSPIFTEFRTQVKKKS